MKKLLRILYLEDDLSDIELMAMAFERYTKTIIELDIAEKVSIANYKYKSGRHDAALLDWNLPDGKGETTAEYIRELSPETPIIFFSQYITPTIEKAAASYAPYMCIEKDFSKDQTVRMLEFFNSAY